MKKTAVPAVLAVLLLVVAAPEPLSAGLIRRGGAKLALTSADQSYSYTSPVSLDPDRRIGVGAAVFLEWFDVPVLSLVTQLEYLPRGMKETFNVTSPDGPEVIGQVEIRNRLDYISLPVLAKARIDLGSIAPYALAGVRIDRLLGYDSDRGAFDPVYADFKKTTVGGSAGAGLEIGSLLPVALLVEVRYNFDLTDSYKSDLLNVTNNSYDLWLGIAL